MYTNEKTTKYYLCKYVHRLCIMLFMTGTSVYSATKLKQNLLWACEIGDIEQVRSLLDSRAYVDQKNGQGATALIVSCTARYRVTAEDWEKAGVLDSSFPEERLATILQNRHMAIAQILILAKADVNVADQKGRTALMEAACKYRIGVIRLLLEAGAHVDYADNLGKTSLFEAVSHNQEAHGTDKVGEHLLCLLAHGADVNKATKSNFTPLMAATARGLTGVVTKLIAAGANVHIADSYGRTALHIAAQSYRTGSPDCHANVICTLLSAGINRNAVNNQGMTALQVARNKIAGNSSALEYESIRRSIQVLEGDRVYNPVLLELMQLINSFTGDSIAQTGLTQVSKS